MKRAFRPALIFLLLLAYLSLSLAESAKSLYSKGRNAEQRQNYEQAYDFYKQAYDQKPQELTYRSAYERLRFLAGASHVHRGQLLREAGRLASRADRQEVGGAHHAGDRAAGQCAAEQPARGARPESISGERPGDVGGGRGRQQTGGERDEHGVQRMTGYRGGAGMVGKLLLRAGRADLDGRRCLAGLRGHVRVPRLRQFDLPDRCSTRASPASVSGMAASVLTRQRRDPAAYRRDLVGQCRSALPLEVRPVPRDDRGVNLYGDGGDECVAETQPALGPMTGKS